MATRSLGTLTLDLIAKLGGFEQGMDKAARISEKRFKQIQAQATAAGVVIGVGISKALEIAGESVAKLFENTEVIANFQDLSEKIGDTGENVASLKKASDVSGVALDSVAAASVKLTAALSKTDDEGKGVGATIKALGLNLDEFKKLSPVEQIDAVAKAMANVEDPARRTAYAVALFGKNGAEIIPFLNDLADGAERHITLTNAQIAAADEFSKSLARTKSALSDAALGFSGQLIPVLQDSLNAFTELTGGVDGLRTIGEDIRRDETLKEWGQNVAIAMAIAGESVYALLKALRAVGGSFESVFADAAFALKLPQKVTTGIAEGFDFHELEDALDQRNKVVADANQRYVDLWNYNGTALSDALRLQFAHVKDVKSFTKDLIDSATGLGSFQVAQDQVSIPLRLGASSSSKPKESTEGIKEQKNAVDDLVSSLADQVATLGYNARAMDLYRAAADGATDADFDRINSLHDSLDAYNEGIEASKAYQKSLEDAAKKLEGFDKAPSFAGIDAVIGGAGGELEKAMQASSDLDAWRSAELKKLKEYREDRGAIVEEGLKREAEIERQYAEKSILIEQARRRATLSVADEIFGNLAVLSRSKHRELIAIGKAAAIAQATISGVQAVQNALAVPPYPLGLALAVTAGIATAANIAEIAGVGFEAGGYTGNMGRKQVAGVVHGREYVFDADATARIGVGNLEALRKGYVVPSVDTRMPKLPSVNSGNTGPATVRVISELGFGVQAVPFVTHGELQLRIGYAADAGAQRGYAMSVQDAQQNGPATQAANGRTGNRRLPIVAGKRS